MLLNPAKGTSVIVLNLFIKTKNSITWIFNNNVYLHENFDEMVEIKVYIMYN